MEDVKLDLKYKVMIHVGRPVGEVFEAVADPKQLSSYFTTGGASGRLETGKTVTWDFARFPRRLPGRGGPGDPGPEDRVPLGAAERRPPSRVAGVQDSQSP